MRGALCNPEVRVSPRLGGEEGKRAGGGPGNSNRPPPSPQPKLAVLDGEKVTSPACPAVRPLAQAWP